MLRDALTRRFLPLSLCSLVIQTCNMKVDSVKKNKE